MATGEEIVCSDGELGIRVGPWAKEKLLYIHNLCNIFNTGMKNIWQNRTYIDLFAGSGRCIIEKSGETTEELEGSPLVALNCNTPFTHYYFNDTNPALIKSLKSRTTLYSSTQLEYFNKDCNSVIDDLLKKLPTNSLDFCFVDPLNWEIKFDSIRRLTKDRKMDLAITFHIGGMKRIATNPPEELTDFFPDSSWKREYEKAKEQGKRTGSTLLDAYKRGLASIGYNYIRDGVLEKNSKNVPIYHLIFASKHPRGSEFWDKITARQISGQVRMQI